MLSMPSEIVAKIFLVSNYIPIVKVDTAPGKYASTINIAATIRAILKPFLICLLSCCVYSDDLSEFGRSIISMSIAVSHIIAEKSQTALKNAMLSKSMVIPRKFHIMSLLSETGSNATVLKIEAIPWKMVKKVMAI